MNRGKFIITRSRGPHARPISDVVKRVVERLERRAEAQRHQDAEQASDGEMQAGHEEAPTRDGEAMIGRPPRPFAEAQGAPQAISD